MTVADPRIGPPRAQFSRGSVLGWVIPLLASYVEHRGRDASQIHNLEGIRGKDLQDPDVRVPQGAAREAWRLTAALTDGDATGVNVAEWLPRGSLELVEYSFRCSSSLGAGMDRLSRYGRLINDRYSSHVLHAGTGVRFSVGAADGGPIHPQRVEFAIALLVRLAREATAVDLEPTEVCFVHAAPKDVSRQTTFFRTAIQHSAPANAIVFTEADGGLPLKSADPALETIIRRRLDKALRVLNTPGEINTAARVRQVLLDRMGQGVPTAAAISREMGVSARTLNRRLEDEGTSVREIRDQVRRDLAVALMMDVTVSVSEIAFFLGYAEPSPFHRSFKRWTGKTPMAFRGRSKIG